MIPVKITKISYYSPSKGYAVVLQELSGERRKLPIIVGSYEAQAIVVANERVVTPRPMTHDLINNIFREMQLDVREVVITDLIDGTFYAEIVIDDLRGRSQKIDSRPSDAFAVALRMGAQIFVDEEVMREAGILDHSSNEMKYEELQHGYKDSTRVLEEQLQRAIEEEEYEKAAILRDKIKQLEEK